MSEKGRVEEYFDSHVYVCKTHGKFHTSIKHSVTPSVSIHIVLRCMYVHLTVCKTVLLNCRSTHCPCGERSSVEVFRLTSCWQIIVQPRRSCYVVRCRSSLASVLRLQSLVQTCGIRCCLPTSSLFRHRRSLPRQTLVPTSRSRPMWIFQCHHGNDSLRCRPLQSRRGDRRGGQGVVCCGRLDTLEFLLLRTSNLRPTTYQ